MASAQRRVGLATVLAIAVVASGFGPVAGPVQAAEPAPPPAAKIGQAPAEDAVLDDPRLLAPELPGAQFGLGGVAQGPRFDRPRAGWDDDRPGLAKVPKYSEEDTLGFTWKDNDMGQWKYQKQGAFEFQIDMGDFANKDQLTKNQKGYWLELLLPTNVAGIQGYFLVDGDGKFDPFNDPGHDGMGDEPCHPGETWDILKLSVNGNLVHTLQGHKEAQCGAGETSRVFEIIPMTQGEPATVFRVNKNWVNQGKNTIKIELLDTPFIHPSRGLISPDDGWYIYLVGAAMQLVAPPWFISGGWSFNPPPGGRDVANSGWEAGLHAKMEGFFLEYFGQTPWGWDISPPSIVPVGTCQQGPGIQSPANGEFTHLGAAIIAKDGKQDFRVSGCEVAKIIRNAEGTLGYCYSCGKNKEGFWYTGFSMGGLIGRWAVQREGLNGQMGKFVTLGTPHFGSHWADIYTQVMDLKGGYKTVGGDDLRKWWGGWKDWANNGVQARYFENNDWQWLPPHWESNGQLFDMRADFELKRWGNAVLDGLNVDRGSISDRTLAVSGQGGTMAGNVASVLTSNPVIKAVGLLAEGDGVVPTDSATAGYTSAFCPAVHHGGVYTYFDSCIFPAFEHFTGYFGTAAAADAAPAADERVLSTAEVATFAAQITPDLVTGEAGFADTVRIEATPWALFTAYWPDDGELRYTLVAPDGTAYTPEQATALGAGYNVEADGLGAVRALWAIPDAMAGTWTVRLNATGDTPAWGTGAVVVVHAESALELTANAPVRVEPGEPVVVTASLSGAADNVAMQAHVMPADVTLGLHDDGLDGDAVAGDGVFSLRYTDTSATGTIGFDVTATATQGGTLVQRTARAMVDSQPRRALAVETLIVEPTQLWWGETARATGVVTNLGATALTDLTVVWTDDSDTRLAAPLQQHIELPALGPGQSTTVNLDWDPTPGVRTLRLAAYTTGVEEDLADNEATATLEVLPSPRTAATLDGSQGLNGWYGGAVEVRLAPFDGTPPPYQATLYRVDGGAWSTYFSAFEVAADGRHTVEFYSVDLQGRAETLRSVAFGIDTTAPQVAITKPVLGINVAGMVVPAPVSRPVVAGLVEVVLPNGDATSGVARVEVRVDGIKVHEFLDPPAVVTWLWDSTATSTGRHTLQVRAFDASGLSHAASLEVYVTASRAVEVESNPNAMVARLMPPLG